MCSAPFLTSVCRRTALPEALQVSALIHTHTHTHTHPTHTRIQERVEDMAWQTFWKVSVKRVSKETHRMPKETHGVSKETHGVSKETHGVSKETHGVSKETYGV